MGLAHSRKRFAVFDEHYIRSLRSWSLAGAATVFVQSRG